MILSIVLFVAWLILGIDTLSKWDNFVPKYDYAIVWFLLMLGYLKDILMHFV